MEALQEFLRYFIAAAFFAGGVLFVVFRRFVGTGTFKFPYLKTDVTTRARIDAAAAGRATVERQLPGFWGVAGTALIVLAAIVSLPSIPVVLSVAIAYAALGALGLAGLFLMTRSPARRGASLRSRTPWNALPLWLLGVTLLGSLVSLLYFRLEPVAAIVAFAAELGLIIAAAGIGSIPAVLPGIDPAAEEFVDDRLRGWRVTSILTLATSQSIMIASLSGVMPSHLATSQPQQFLFFALYLCAAFAMMAQSARTIYLMRAGPNVRRYPDLITPA